MLVNLLEYKHVHIKFYYIKFLVSRPCLWLLVLGYKNKTTFPWKIFTNVAFKLSIIWRKRNNYEIKLMCLITLLRSLQFQIIYSHWSTNFRRVDIFCSLSKFDICLRFLGFVKLDEWCMLWGVTWHFDTYAFTFLPVSSTSRFLALSAYIK
mgnify:CR=1 FL=1